MPAIPVNTGFTVLHNLFNGSTARREIRGRRVPVITEISNPAIFSRNSSTKRKADSPAAVKVKNIPLPDTKDAGSEIDIPLLQVPQTEKFSESSVLTGV